MGKYTVKWTENQRDYLIAGLPGVGKTYFIEKEIVPELIADEGARGEYTERFVVTESATQEDLFGAYMPVVEGERISYAFVPGPAARAIRKAYAAPEATVVLIIENLNSGNAYEVFGNLFQLLDRNRDGESEYPVSVTEEVSAWFFAGVAAAADRCKGKLYLPKNLYILGTMSTSSHVAFKLDTAFRRRFRMVYIDADGEIYGNVPSTRETIHGDTDTDCCTMEAWEQLREKINANIPVEDKMLSRYFVKQRDGQISHLDLIVSVVSHLLENVRKENLKDPKILAVETLEEALQKYKSGQTLEDMEIFDVAERRANVARTRRRYDFSGINVG